MNVRLGMRIGTSARILAASSLACILAVGLPPTAASAALPPATAFFFTGAEQTYVVPADVAVVLVHATGGFGGPAFNQGGGQGEDLTAYLPVTPNETLYTEVGQNGSPAGAAGFGGGAAGGAQTASDPRYNVASSGGGATDVRTCSETAASCPGGVTSDSSRLIVAGGGGGSGGYSVSQYDACGGGGFAGGANGNVYATTPAGTFVRGIDGTAVAPSTPSRGGSEAAPGTGGVTSSCVWVTTNYADSVAGDGGSGTSGGSGGPAPGVAAGGGGGGGGGYFGGGGGASGNNIWPTEFPAGSDGAGGAGGSSFVTTGALVGNFGGGQSVPQVTYTPEITIDSPANGATYTPGQVVNASFACDPAVFSACTGPAGSGQPIDTSAVGPHSFVVTGTIYHSTVSGTVSYTVSPPLPTITALSPTNGLVTGGQTVTITGTNFTDATKVKFGTTLGTSLVVVSPTTITVTSPAHAAGTVAIRVTTSEGISASVPADRYKYVPPPPAITSITPTSGPTAGGQTVTIIGTNFAGATKVKFGPLAAASFTVISSTEITTVTPAHAAGTISIRVSTAGGPSPLVTADRYMFSSALESSGCMSAGWMSR